MAIPPNPIPPGLTVHQSPNRLLSLTGQEKTLPLCRMEFPHAPISVFLDPDAKQLCGESGERSGMCDHASSAALERFWSP